MKRIDVDEERVRKIDIAIQRSLFSIVDMWGNELPQGEYVDFIKAMFSGNPSVNLNKIERRIRIMRGKKEGV